MRHITEEGRRRIIAGAHKANEVIRKKHRDRYLANPSHCTFCGEQLLYEKRHNKFCNHSCSATYNNKPKERVCLSCSTVFIKKNGTVGKFCKLSCQAEYKNKQRTILLDSLNDFKSVGIKTLRNYFKAKNNNTCKICAASSWNGVPIPLVLDHIDGNSDNWKRENLRMVCPNCDALLPTYKSKNKGKGRASRRQRYAEGKSY